MLKRPLVPAVILFLLGIFLAAYSVNLIITILLCFAICGFILYKTRKPLILAFAVLLIFTGMGRMAIADNQREKIIAAHSGKKEVMELTVVDFSFENSATAYFYDDGKKHKVILRYESDIDLFPGDIVEGEITLNQPRGSKVRFPGYVESLAGNGVYLVANAEKISLTCEREGGISGFLSSLRVYMNNLGEKYFEGDDRALFNAMVIGDKRLISDELYASLQASGLNHIAVVSGMHLSVAITFLLVIARLLFGKRRICYIFVLFGAFLLMLLTGAGSSVVRAFIMCAVSLTAELLYRDNDSPTSLSLAVLLMAAMNPFIIFNVGFILSVLSVMGILLYNRKISDTLIKFTPEKMTQVLSLSISAQLAVFPVVVYYFGTVSPYSLLSNALLVPVSGIYVILGMVFIILSPIPVVPDIIALIMKLLSGCISSVSAWVKNLPASLTAIDGNVFLLFAIWVILLVLLAAHPIRRRKVVAASVAVALCCVVVCMPKDGVEIYPIAYGSRTMTVMSFPKGDSFLIDCPDSYDALIIEKESSPFKAVVLSGNDSGKVFSANSNIERIIASDHMLRGKEREKVVTLAKEKNIHLIFLDDYEKWQIGDTVIEYVPIEGFEQLCAVKVYYGGKTYLSFQGIDGTDIMKFGESGVRFESDYVILPYTAFACDKEFFTGEVIK